MKKRLKYAMPRKALCKHRPELLQDDEVTEDTETII